MSLLSLSNRWRVAAVCAIAATATLAEAQTFNAELVANGLADPLYVTTPPNEDRLFVLEQNTARIRIIDDGVLLPAPFLDIGAIASSFGERGLLGLAFHPDYEDNGYFFVNYTGNGGNTVVRRYTRLTPDQADNTSGVTVLTQNQPFSNHNGGCIQFGPDGYLYIGFGDGGSANDPQCNAQNPATWLGKMLRIDIDTIDTTGSYSVPASNPFVGDPTILPEIYLFGLRNPWRFSFDKQTGDLYIGDVGQFAREEVDVLPFGQAAGLNLGWRVYEGFSCIGLGSCPSATTPGCSSPAYTDPVLQYGHSGGACSITGGYVYRGCAIPEAQGRYFYADYCSAFIRSTEVVGGVASTPVNHTSDLSPGGGLNIQTITSFGEDRNGELYIVDQNGGEIWKIVPENAPVACQPLTSKFDSLSITDGGWQSFVLDAGAANAGGIYLLTGSASGTSPGIPVDGLTVPLNLDGYLLAVVATPNLPPLEDGLGVLDANGRGEAAFTIPAGALNPGLAGNQLHHAFVVLGPTGAVSLVSNPVAVNLES